MINGRELRCLHDTVQQRLHALKSMGHDPPGPFITSMLELKVDLDTMFEWHRHSQASTDVTHYNELLKFLDLRAQTSEASNTKSGSRMRYTTNSKKNNFLANLLATSTGARGIPTKCKWLFTLVLLSNHSPMIKNVHTQDYLNCMGADHFMKQCKSVHWCQKSHRTLLHLEAQSEQPASSVEATHSITST